MKKKRVTGKFKGFSAGNAVYNLTGFMQPVWAGFKLTQWS